MHTQSLGLTHAADTIVGNATLRGISGGEKRRVSIATEIAAGHALLLADLPTNGWDFPCLAACLPTCCCFRL